MLRPDRGEEVESVLLELTVAEQPFIAVMEVLRDSLSVVEVAERYGVSRQAVHGWLRYGTGGVDALADRSHRPCGLFLGGMTAKMTAALPNCQIHKLALSRPRGDLAS